MNDFLSYHWNPLDLKDDKLISAFHHLIADSSLLEEKIQAFGILLNSDSDIAQGIAFDHYCYSHAMSRFGLKRPFGDYLDELLDKARKQLRRSSVISRGPESDQLIEGANYASAFGVLEHLGDESDLDLILPILNSSTDTNVLFSGCMAAESCFDNPSHSVYFSTMSRIILNDKIHENAKERAISALKECNAPEIDSLLIKVAKEYALPVAAYAARTLGHRNLEQHSALLLSLCKQWPQNSAPGVNDVYLLLHCKE